MPEARERDNGCPFIDRDDHRCARHFSLHRIDEAFDVCVNRFLACPTYYRLLREQNLVTTLTLNGQPFAAARHARAAGA